MKIMTEDHIKYIMRCHPGVGMRIVLDDIRRIEEKIDKYIDLNSRYNGKPRRTNDESTEPTS